jgi:hypothetical protein
MAKRHNAAGPRRIPRRSERTPEEVAALVLRSFVHALGITRFSQAQAARAMGVSLSTVQRGVAGKVPINPLHVLRSMRLALPFALHLCRLVAVRNGRR